MSSIPKETKKLKQLISNLFVQDEKKVLQTIALMESEGNSLVLAPLYELYQEKRSGKINSKIEEFFTKLSDSSAAPVIIDLLRKEETSDYRKMLLGTCWQNKLDFSPYLADFVAIASGGDFQEVFECLTIIENLEGPFEETQILESQLYLKEFLETERGKNEQKDEMMSEIAILLKDFDRALDTE